MSKSFSRGGFSCDGGIGILAESFPPVLSLTVWGVGYLWSSHILNACSTLNYSLALPFFGRGMYTDLFQSCGHCWVFQICCHNECSTLTASKGSVSVSKYSQQPSHTLWKMRDSEGKGGQWWTSSQLLPSRNWALGWRPPQWPNQRCTSFVSWRWKVSQC